MRHRLTKCALALLLVACSDSAGDSTDVGVVDVADTSDVSAEVSADAVSDVHDAAIDRGPIPDPSAVAAEPPAATFFRLTQSQYRNTLSDLFGPIVLPVALEPDIEAGGFASVGAGTATTSARGVALYEDAALNTAQQIFAPGRSAEFVPCEPASDVDSACAEQALATLGERIWRRPLEDGELESVIGVFETVAAAESDFYVGMEYATAVLLQSPSFLFRTEVGGADGRLDDWELAAKLSFFLWNTTPDDELLDAARAGELSTDEGLRVQAERLLASPRAREGVRNFFTEYFGLAELDHLQKDPDRFTHMTPELGGDAREETLRLLEHIIFDEPQDFANLLTTRTSFVNRGLAAIYDVPAPTREGFGQIELPRNGPRRGLLGHASLLALHAHPTSSSATLRGFFVRQTLLCGVIPPPPADVDTSIPEPSADAPTLRERVASHLEVEECAGCHLLMDPIGLGLENFDGIGRFRAIEGGALIDASGDLDGAAFSGAPDLGEAVAEHPDFARCVVRNLFRYATGRVENRSQIEVIDALADWWVRGESRLLQPLLLELVVNPSFHTVRREAP